MSDNLYSWFPRALVMGAAVVGLSGLPARAQQITDPSPAQAATNVEPTSPISASFRSQDGVSVRPETVRVFVDGKKDPAEKGSLLGLGRRSRNLSLGDGARY